MRVPRIYQPQLPALNTPFELDDDAANHVGRVLRMKAGQMLCLFNGDGYDYSAEIISCEKRTVSAILTARQENASESPMQLHLGQVISRGERMEFTIQKSVELGVSCITPLISERCGVKLSSERFDKKIQQWQKIAIAACEQSGRSVVPQINALMSLDEWIAQDDGLMKLNLHPKAPYNIKTLPKPECGVRLLIGPEGGLSDEEIARSSAQGFIETQLGPRVLRTETASLAAIVALQCQFGDFA